MMILPWDLIPVRPPPEEWEANIVVQVTPCVSAYRPAAAA